MTAAPTPEFNATAKPAPEYADSDAFMRAVYDEDSTGLPKMQAYIDKFGKEHVDTPRGGDLSYSALHWAAKRGSLAPINFLLDNGANIERPDNTGMTPMLIAAWMGNNDAILLFFKRGANRNAVDKDGLDATAIALKNNRPDTAAFIKKIYDDEFKESLKFIKSGSGRKLAARTATFTPKA